MTKINKNLLWKLLYPGLCFSSLHTKIFLHFTLLFVGGLWKFSLSFVLSPLLILKKLQHLAVMFFDHFFQLLFELSLRLFWRRVFLLVGVDWFIEISRWFYLFEWFFERLIDRWFYFYCLWPVYRCNLDTRSIFHWNAF